MLPRLTALLEILHETPLVPGNDGETILKIKGLNFVYQEMLNITDEFGMAALHWAAFKRLTDTTDLLIHMGARVNMATNIEYGSFRDFKPIHFAAFSQDPTHGASEEKSIKELVIVLLKHGSDINSVAYTNDGPLTPLKIAQNCHLDGTVKLLKEFGAREIIFRTTENKVGFRGHEIDCYLHHFGGISE